MSLAIVLSSCAHMGRQVHRAVLPEGVPEVSAIWASLAENDSSIENFKAPGSFMLESPDLSGIKRFKYGMIAFRCPDDLYVLGKNDLGMTVFRLTSVGREFLIEFPSSSDRPYHQFDGERFENVPFSVSPSDVAREMFLPESWADLKTDEVRVVDYDAAAQTVVLEIGSKRSPRRRLTVQGPPWDVIKNERLDKHGDIVAVTSREKYEIVDGIRFPMEISVFFPAKNTRMTFSMRKVQLNAKLDPSIFDIKSRAQEAGVKY